MKKIPLVALIIISLLGCCMELDISVPSFPSIMAFFGATEAQVQHTLSLNFLSFCLSGLLYGPLSEGWGRRRLMLFGATCFMLGAVGCVLSSSIYQLMFWRFVQGLGASSTLIIGFAMISDQYHSETAAKYIGSINAYVTIFMAAAPIIGSVLICYFPWRANFIAIALIAFAAWLLLLFYLPETRHERHAISLSTILKNYGSLLTHRKFMLLSTMPNMLVTAYLTFVGTASFYYINTCGMNYFQFALHQGLVVLSFSMMSFYAGKVIQTIGPERALNMGVSVGGVSIALFAAVAYWAPLQPIGITLSMCGFAIGCAFPMSVTFAESLSCIPNLKGTSASFIMSSRLLISSIAVALTGVYFDGSMRPVAAVNLIAASIALLLYWNIRKTKKHLVCA